MLSRKPDASNGASTGAERRLPLRRFVETLRLESGDKRTSDEHARAWRRGFFVLVLLFGFSEKGRWDLEHRAAPAPFVIQHDRQTGEYTTLGPAKETEDPTVPDRKVAVGRFVADLLEVDGAPYGPKRRRINAHVIDHSQAADFVRVLFDRSDHDPTVIGARHHRSVRIDGYDVKAPDGSVMDVTYETQVLTLDDQPEEKPLRFTAHVEMAFVSDMPEAKLWDDPERLRMRVFRVEPAPSLQ